MTDIEPDIPVLKYVGLFALTYFILHLALSLFLSIIHTEYYQTILIIGASASLPAYRFIEENGRILSKTERFKIIIGTFLCTILINATYLLREKMISGGGVGSRFINEQVVDFIILWLVFGPFSKDIFKRRQNVSQHVNIKYYSVRILAALFVMGSFGGGFLIGAQYGKWMGWIFFFIMMAFGLMLHKAAYKIDRS